MTTKISLEHFEAFRDDDIKKLSVATNVGAVEAATESSLRLVLPGRSGPVALLVEVSGQRQHHASTFFLISLHFH